MSDNVKCYISGQTPTQFYSFGESVVLPLSQEVFAKFILRATEDEEHQQIMSDLKIIHEDRVAQEEQVNRAIRDYQDGFKVEENIADLQLQLVVRDADFRNKLIDKARSGLRILNEIKREYED